MGFPSLLSGGHAYGVSYYEGGFGGESQHPLILSRRYLAISVHCFGFDADVEMPVFSPQVVAAATAAELEAVATLVAVSVPPFSEFSV